MQYFILKQIRKKLLCILFFVFFGCTSYAGNIHFYAFFNTLDSTNDNSDNIKDYREGALYDFERSRLKVKEIATFLKFGYKEHSYIGADFNIKNIKNIIKADAFSVDDIVIFQIGCHGYRFNNQQSKFPTPLISNTYGSSGTTIDQISIHFEQYFNSLYEKKPRLLIAIVDACNNSNNRNAPDNWEQGLFALAGNDITKSPIAERYKDLFLNVKGKILISSVSPTETIPESSSKGSLFMEQFWSTMDKYVTNNNSVSWNLVLNEIREKTLQSSKIVQQKKIRNTICTPFWSESTSYDLFNYSNKGKIENEPFNQFEIYIQNGKKYYLKKEYSNAIIEFRKALNIKPYFSYAKFYIFLCEAYLNYEEFSTVDQYQICNLLNSTTDLGFLKEPDFMWIQYCIAVSYLYGTKGSKCKLKKDYIKAIDWFKIASNNGLQCATERLNHFGINE